MWWIVSGLAWAIDCGPRSLEGCLGLTREEVEQGLSSLGAPSRFPSSLDWPGLSVEFETVAGDVPPLSTQMVFDPARYRGAWPFGMDPRKSFAQLEKKVGAKIGSGWAEYSRGGVTAYIEATGPRKDPDLQLRLGDRQKAVKSHRNARGQAQAAEQAAAQQAHRITIRGTSYTCDPHCERGELDVRLDDGTQIRASIVDGAPKGAVRFIPVEGNASWIEAPIDSDWKPHGPGQAKVLGGTLTTTFEHGRIAPGATSEVVDAGGAVRKGSYDLASGFRGEVQTIRKDGAEVVIVGDFVAGKPAGTHVARSGDGRELARAEYTAGRAVSGSDLYGARHAELVEALNQEARAAADGIVAPEDDRRRKAGATLRLDENAASMHRTPFDLEVGFELEVDDEPIEVVVYGVSGELAYVSLAATGGSETVYLKCEAAGAGQCAFRLKPTRVGDKKLSVGLKVIGSEDELRLRVWEHPGELAGATVVPLTSAPKPMPFIYEELYAFEERTKQYREELASYGWTVVAEAHGRSGSFPLPDGSVQFQEKAGKRYGVALVRVSGAYTSANLKLLLGSGYTRQQELGDFSCTFTPQGVCQAPVIGTGSSQGRTLEVQATVIGKGEDGGFILAVVELP